MFLYRIVSQFPIHLNKKKSLVSTCPGCFQTAGLGCLVLGFRGKSWRSWRQNYFEERCLGKPITSQEAWKIWNGWMVSRMEPCNFPYIFPRDKWLGREYFGCLVPKGFFIANILDFRRSGFWPWSWMPLAIEFKNFYSAQGFFAPGLVFFLSHLFLLFSLQGSFWIHLRSSKFYHLGLFPEE